MCPATIAIASLSCLLYTLYVTCLCDCLCLSLLCCPLSLPCESMYLPRCISVSVSLSHCVSDSLSLCPFACCVCLSLAVCISLLLCVSIRSPHMCCRCTASGAVQSSSTTHGWRVRFIDDARCSWLCCRGCGCRRPDGDVRPQRTTAQARHHANHSLPHSHRRYVSLLFISSALSVYFMCPDSTLQQQLPALVLFLNNALSLL